MKDRQGFEFEELLQIQARQLAQWEPRLRPDVFAAVRAYVLKHNREADAGAVHRVYRGMDLMLIVYDWPNLCSAYEPVAQAHACATSDSPEIPPELETINHKTTMFEKFLAILADLVTAIQANTAALQRIAAASSDPTPVPASAPAPTPAAEAEKPKRSKTKETPAAAPAPEPAAPAAPALAITDLTKLATEGLDLNDNDSSFIKAINAKHGLAKLSEAKPEIFGAVMADLRAAVEAIKAKKSAASDI